MAKTEIELRFRKLHHHLKKLEKDYGETIKIRDKEIWYNGTGYAPGIREFPGRENTPRFKNTDKIESSIIKKYKEAKEKTEARGRAQFRGQFPKMT